MTTIYRMLDASTAHLPATLRADLNEQPGLTVDRRQFGWLLFVPEDIDDTVETVLADTAQARGIDDDNEIDPDIDGIPQPVIDLWLCARAHDCQYILLDTDGPVLSGLNIYS